MPPVRIVNPIAGHGFTSHNRAARFVRSGRARWTDTQYQREIEFVVHAKSATSGHRPHLAVVCDATPGRAVCPPWPGWDRHLLTSGVAQL